ncbi:MAG: NUDIX domain-containing protein [Bacteroidota bacterium]
MHPGGPFFKNKDAGVWSVPKGEPDDDNENLLDAACREFNEETSIEPNPPYIELGHIFQKNNKKVFAWGFEGDWPDDKPIESNCFMLEWPPKSGNKIEIPEVDKGEWFDIRTAKEKVIAEQLPLIERLVDKLK